MIEKANSSDADQARPQPSLPQDGTQCRESAPQHHGEERRRGPASQGNRHAGQTCKAQHRAQEQGRQPQKRHPAARERALSHFAQNSKPPDEGGFFISSPHPLFRLTASGNTPLRAPPFQNGDASRHIPPGAIIRTPPCRRPKPRYPTTCDNTQSPRQPLSAPPRSRRRLAVVQPPHRRCPTSRHTPSKKKPPAHLRTARSPTLSGNSRTVYSFSANPCARSRISDPSGVTR